MWTRQQHIQRLADAMIGSVPQSALVGCPEDEIKEAKQLLARIGLKPKCESCTNLVQIGDEVERSDMARRRLAAAHDILAGIKLHRVAMKYAVSRTTVYRWDKLLRNQGMAALQPTRATGRPPALSFNQFEELKQVFKENPMDYGFRKWTCRSLARVIFERFGVRYNPDHVGRLMHRLGS